MIPGKAPLAKAAALVLLIAACSHVRGAGASGGVADAAPLAAPAAMAQAAAPAAPAPAAPPPATTPEAMATTASGAALLAPDAAVPDALIEAPGKKLVLARCGVCHHPNIVSTVHHTEDEWGELVGQMIARGAMVPDDEYDPLMAYLVRNYPPLKP